MTYAKSRIKLIAVLVSVASVIYTIGVHAPIANALDMSIFSNELTNPDDVSAGGVKGKMDLHLKNVEGIAVVNTNKMAVYYPASMAKEAEDGELKTTTDMYLKITRSRDIGHCEIPSRKDGADGNIQVTVLGDVVYNKPVQMACDDFIGKTIRFKPNRAFIPDKKNKNGLVMAPIEVKFTGKSLRPKDISGDKNLSDAYSLNYNVVYHDPLSGKKGKLALIGNTKSDEFGIRSSYRDSMGSAPNRQLKASIPFGFPCGIDPDDVLLDKRSAKLYDPDPGFGETYMWITKGGQPLEREQYDTRDFQYIENPNGSGWDNDNKRWKVQEVDRKTAVIVLKNDASVISDKSTYRLVIFNSGKKKDGTNSDLNPHGNTLSLSIPQDSINAITKCEYSLEPRVNPPKPPTSSVSAGASVPVRGHVIVDGYDKDNHTWQLTAHVFEAGEKPKDQSGRKNNLGPCDWKPGKRCTKVADGSQGSKKFEDDRFDTDMYSYSTADLEKDDWVCFVMSVKRPTPNEGDKWAHSDMKCVQNAGEVVGTTVKPPTYSYYPDLKVTATVENKGGYPKVDNFQKQDYTRNKYEWKILEAKFSNKPSSIDIAEAGDCSVVERLANYLSGSCQPVAEGPNLFPTNVSRTTKTANNADEGPDPIGTWTCYTTTYRKNPKPLDSLKRDIDLYVDDWNDPDYNSRNPRWTDGRYLDYVDTSYYDSATDKWVNQGYYVWRGEEKNAEDIWNQYLKDDPDSTVPEYKFTPYKRNSCSISGVDPKVQIKSHDLQVGGKIDSWIRTITRGAGIGSYGSNAEYGVLSGGVNAQMASGSGLLSGGPEDQSNWSSLTFTNDNPSMFGYFSGVLQANRPSASEAEEISSAGQISLAPGTKKVYHVSGKLTIDSDLKYPTGYGQISDIPRVIIIADTIEIGPNVKQIDPWLVAENISTCNTINTDYNLTPSQALGEADLTNKKCSNPLIFNGPVYVANLYLYRTGGSRLPRSDLDPRAARFNFDPDAEAGIDPEVYCDDKSCVDRKYALSAPAEVFNLRPDVYLSSLSGLKTNKPAAITDKITELPPRF